MRTKRLQKRLSPGMLDWIVERAETGMPARRPPRAILPVGVDEPPPIRTLTERLRLWSENVGFDWKRGRVIEIATGLPRLVELFADEAARERLILLQRGVGSLLHWSGRFPEARFYQGSVRSLAKISPGRFDWAADLGALTETRGDDATNPCAPLGEILRKRGILFLRLRPTSRQEWIWAHAQHERAKLRILGCERLDDSSHLVISRRQ